MATTTITLTKVHCNETSETGHDEVYIEYTIDGGRPKRFPDKGYQSMGSGSDDNNWYTDLPLTFKDSVLVSLCDNDTFGDESLGSHTYRPNDPQPETVTVSNPNGANYTLSTT